MRIKYSLRELETFLAIADHGTFAAAGEVVGLTQSAVSLQIKSLEATLETELFDRSRRPPVMNARGLKLVSRAREILKQCEAMYDDVREHTLGGLLRLGVVPSVMGGILPATLRELQYSHPRLMIELSSGLSVQLLREVNSGRLDAAIVTEPAQLGRGLSWQAFAEEPLVLIVPAEAPEKTDTQLLQAYPFIQFHPETYAGQQIATLLQDRGIRVASRMKLDSLDSIAQMVAKGLGVSLLPRRNIEHPFPPGVKQVPFGSHPVTRVIGIVERASSPKRELIQVLTEVLMRQQG